MPGSLIQSSSIAPGQAHCCLRQRRWPECLEKGLGGHSSKVGVPSASLSPAARSILRRIGLLRLRGLTDGSNAVRIALIDGPIGPHDCLSGARITRLQDSENFDHSSVVSRHATFIASMLVGRGQSVLGLCPGCTVLSIPVVNYAMTNGMISTNIVAKRLAAAVMLAIAERADVIQLGLEFPSRDRSEFAGLKDALAVAAKRGVRTVMPAGNQPTLDASPLLESPGVVPVAMSDHHAAPDPRSTWGPTIAGRGLMCPGTNLPGALSPKGYTKMSGTSFAATLVTGAFALLCSSAFGDRDAAWNVLLEPVWRGARASKSIPPPLDVEAGLSGIQCAAN